jgi:hypothetical protein
MVLLIIFIIWLNAPIVRTSKILKMKIDKVATSDIIATVPSTTLRHRSVPRWLSVAETTNDEESAEILNSILELI